MTDLTLKMDGDTGQAPVEEKPEGEEKKPEGEVKPE